MAGRHTCCAEALAAWRSAETRVRAAAYRVYQAALEREEVAAAELERLNPPRVAAQLPPDRGSSARRSARYAGTPASVGSQSETSRYATNATSVGPAGRPKATNAPDHPALHAAGRLPDQPLMLPAPFAFIG